ncbi:MAG: TonB-dependent receptor plug domain-containing protein [Bacteroidia bacterium]|nr:TonB-dependent receptor plug domain-containing protein [Bacteroidia bacterium]MDG2041458.1 TonB-dependent receptor plug domain-containing protein [Bacteroidia bacterium]
MQKIGFIILFLIALSSNAQTFEYDKRVTLSFSGYLLECIDSIENQTNVHFNYKIQNLVDKHITLKCLNEPLRNILIIIEDSCGLSHDRLDDKIINLFPYREFVISGSIIDVNSSERVSNAVIKLNNNMYVVSDQMGMFQLSVPNREVSIDVYHPGYQISNNRVRVNQNQYLYIRLKPVTNLETVEITIKDSLVQDFKDYDQINSMHLQIPSLNGKIDALNSIKLIPGIQNVSYGQQGLSVRGGGPDQNFILVDGIPVYNTFHLMGLYSIFNTPIVNNIRVYKDVFPSKYSNRLSSIVDIGLNNGNKNKTELFLDLGLLSSAVAVNGPIVKNKLSYSFSARRTYLDLLIRPLQNIEDRSNAIKNKSYLWSLDLFGKIHYQINEHNQLSFTSYYGGDQLNFTSKLNVNSPNQFTEKTEGALGWRNTLLGMKWNSKLTSRVLLTTEASISSYTLNFTDEYSLDEDNNYSSNSSNYKSGIREIHSSMDANVFLNDRNLAKIGFGIANYNFLPYERTYKVTDNDYASSIFYDTDTIVKSSSFDSYEYFSFIENKTYFRSGYVNYGIRLTQYSNQTNDFIYFQPKLFSLFNLTKKSQLRIGYSITNQFIQLIPNNNLGLPIDIWFPVSNALKPISANQFICKLAHNYSHGNFSIGFFDKRFRHIAEYNLNTPNLYSQNWEANINQGIGSSYGLESNFDMKFDKLSLNLAYTYCRSNRTIENINNGELYYSKFDRPHDFSIWTSHSFSDNKKLMISFNYISGNPITLPVGRYVTFINDEPVILEDFDQINNFRLPAIHHLDISYAIEKQHKKFKSTLVFGVYNIYNRFNPFMAFIGLDESSDPVLKIRSLMPILPIAKYSIKI